MYRRGIMYNPFEQWFRWLTPRFAASFCRHGSVNVKYNPQNDPDVFEERTGTVLVECTDCRRTLRVPYERSIGNTRCIMLDVSKAEIVHE